MELIIFLVVLGLYICINHFYILPRQVDKLLNKDNEEFDKYLDGLEGLITKLMERTKKTENDLNEHLSEGQLTKADKQKLLINPK